MSSEHPQDQNQEQKFNNAGKPLADVGLKWGRSPKTTTPAVSDDATNSNIQSEPDWENYFSEEEKEKLRSQGINPALKAEMDAKKKSSKSGGFWGKVAQTAAGGGFIK